ncbi:MAG: MotA/TolQ/ExbB proton channel family protein [Chlamydiae bacterium]|nr:MotA/TolQ/ExbB proton channel family protein [Chlamydiota bacterium]
MSFVFIANIQAFTTAFTESDLFGKLIILSLLFVSIICWIILSYKIWQAKKVKKESLIFQNTIEKYKDQFLNIDLDSLPKSNYLKIPTPYQKIFASLKNKAIETLNKKAYFLEHISHEKKSSVYLSNIDLELLESHVYTEISIQSKLLEKDLFILSTTVTLAPFLGLLGTVWGILVTFSELQGGASASSNSAVIGGLSTALSTTVMGLVIAIPALIGYNYLKNNLRVISSDMEDFLHNLLSTLELQYRKVDVS